MTRKYNLVLLDDHRVVLESMANLLETDARFRVVAQVADEASLLAALDGPSPEKPPVDVLITDFLIPRLNVPDLIGRVKRRHPHLGVLVLSGSADAAFARQALHAGANGYMTKTADKHELFDAIVAVAAGRQPIDGRVFTLEEAPTAAPVGVWGGPTPLTARESEIARLIVDELSSAEIAERLFISFNTVETHRKRIYQKLGVNTSLGLMKHLLNQERLN